MTEISGQCDDQFAAVKAAFEENFESRGDIGASVAVYRQGECLVDLWGGSVGGKATAPWEKDTLVNIWSTTKGITAACFAMAVDRGVLAYNDKVVDHWPEFGAAGKDAVTVAMLLSHQAGLCGFRDATTLEDLYDVHRGAERLAAAEPFWVPGDKSGYHAITMGMLASELLRRAEGRTVAQFVEDELRQGLGLDIFIGVPEAERSRVSDLEAPPEMGSNDVGKDFTPAQIAALANPFFGPTVANSPEWRSAEIPSANGHATARSLAQLYCALACDGRIDGRTIADQRVIQQATRPQIEGVDAVLSIDARWSCGFLINSNGLYGPNPDSFGHSGWGGSFAFGDPSTGIAVAYTMNQMGTDLVGDPRNTALINAVYASVKLA